MTDVVEVTAEEPRDAGHHIAGGMAEEIEGVFHSADALIAMLYLCCGGIVLDPPLPKPTH